MAIKENLVAIYCRLSSEDGMDNVSISIENQMDICKKYVNDNGLTLYNIYIDDGYSGSTFDRLGFQNMINDLELKRFGCIIVKDLSRLGRNFLKVSYYVEDYFVANRIRFISIQDNYDSKTADTEELGIAIKNFLNGYYLKECSKKMRVGHKNRAKHGTLSTLGHYGYLVEDNNYIIDEETAPIVQEIFKRYISGETVKSICEYLKDSKILTPSHYFNSRHKNNRILTKSGKYDWQNHSIYTILKDEQYTGTQINFRYSTSKYGKKLCKSDRSLWQKKENTHEAIIKNDDFIKAQEILKERNTKNKQKNHLDVDNLGLKGIVFTDSGRAMNFSGTFNSEGKLFKTTYYSNFYEKIYVKSQILHDVVFRDIKKLIKQIKISKEQFIEMTQKKKMTIFDEKEIYRVEKRIKDIDIDFQVLFEKLVAEEIDDIEYELSNRILNEELQSLNIKINELITKKKIIETKMKKLISFIDVVNELSLEEDKLKIIKALVSKVIVSKKDDGYKFKIIYNFEK